MSDSGAFMPEQARVLGLPPKYEKEVSIYDMGTIEVPVRIHTENAPHLIELYSAIIGEDKLFSAMVNAPLPRGWRFTRMEAQRSQESIDLVFCTNTVPELQDFLDLLGACRSQEKKFRLINETKDAKRRQRSIDYHSRMRK